MTRKPLSPSFSINGGQSILNLTQFPATPEQVAAGVVDPGEETRIEIYRNSTFTSLPSPALLQSRARNIVDIATRSISVFTQFSPYVMINPPPYLVKDLTVCLKDHDLVPVFPFSIWERTGERGENGRRPKLWHHAGFIEAIV